MKRKDRLWYNAIEACSFRKTVRLFVLRQPALKKTQKCRFAAERKAKT